MDEDELLDEEDLVDGASEGSDDAARMGIQSMQVGFRVGSTDMHGLVRPAMQPRCWLRDASFDACCILCPAAIACSHWPNAAWKCSCMTVCSHWPSAPLERLRLCGSGARGGVGWRLRL